MKTNLLIIRDTFTKESTVGKLYVNGEFYGYTLELPWKDNERRVSCIPQGVYDVRKRDGAESGKFNYEHLYILNVPNREYILFHIGNKPSDILGCVLLGINKSENFVSRSTVAFKALMKDLEIVIN
jgi:hypothetical protein